MKRDLKLFIEDIKESIKNIEDFSKGLSKEKFSKDLLKQSAIIRQLEIIGESTKSIPQSFKEKYKEIPWKSLAGLRDILSHAYFRVDVEMIWRILEKDLSILKKEISKIKID